MYLWLGVQMDPSPPPVPPHLISDEAQTEIYLTSVISLEW